MTYNDIRLHRIIPALLILNLVLTSFCWIIGAGGVGVALFFSFLGLTLLFYFYVKNDQDFLNPDGVFSFLWLFVLGISNLRLSKGQATWDFMTWAVLLGSWIAYMLGSFLIERTLNIRKNEPCEEEVEIDKDDSGDKFRRTLKIFFIMSFFSFIFEVAVEGYIPILSKNMSAYVEFGLPFIHYNTVAMSIITILMFYYILKYKKDNVINVMLIIGVLQIVSILSRQLLIFILVGMVIVYQYTRRRFKLSQIAILVLISFLAFSALGSLRNQSLDYLYEVAQIKPGIVKSSFMWPYLYLTMGFENMRNLIHLSLPLTFGRFMFTPFYALSRLTTILPALSVNNLTIREFNVSTYLFDIFMDFGLVGTIIVPFLIGLVSKYIYIAMTKTRKVLYLFLYIFVLHNLLFTFFVNFYSNTSIVINILYTIIICKFSFQKTDKFGRSKQNES